MRQIVRVALLTAMMAATTFVARADQSVATMLDPYFRIQEALVADRTDTLKSDAETMAKAAGDMGADGTSIKAAATELQSTTNLADARLAFGKLSAAVIEYSERTKANPGGDVVQMYCPMVKKSWLQKGETVRNPYYGKAMPGCGEKKKAS